VDWQGLIRGPINADERMELNHAEEQLLQASAGFIVAEGNQGFVTVSYYNTESELEKVWSELLEAQKQGEES